MTRKRWRSGQVFEPTAEEDVRQELAYHLDERVRGLIYILAQHPLHQVK